MNNKILVSIYIPKIDKNYDVYISINERLFVIIDEISISLSNVSGIDLKINKETAILLNMLTGTQYSLEKFVIDTDIRNGTKLLIM